MRKVRNGRRQVQSVRPVAAIRLQGFSWRLRHGSALVSRTMFDQRSCRQLSCGSGAFAWFAAASLERCFRRVDDGPVRRLIRGWWGCAAALLIVACSSAQHPANRRVSEVVSCLRARGLLTGVPASEIGIVVGPEDERVVPVIAGPNVIAGIYVFQSTAAAKRPFDRRVPAGSPAASAFQAGNVALITLAIPARSATARSVAEATASAKVCAFGADASRAQAYAPAAPTVQPAPVSYGAAPPPGYAPGRLALAESGCLGCHRIGTVGNVGPGPDLSDVGRRLSRSQILKTLVNPTAPMPSYRNIPPNKLRALVVYLSRLR